MSEILLSGNDTVIRNNTLGGAINSQTSTSGTGELVTRFIVGENESVAANKLETKAGIIAPSTAITYENNMVGHVIYESKSTSISNDVTVSTTSPTIPIGVWTVQIGTIIMRGTGTYVSGSRMVSNLMLSTGVADIHSPVGQLVTLLPASHTASSVSILVGYTVVVKEPSVFMNNDTVTMTVSATTTRSVRFLFTRIA